MKNLKNYKRIRILRKDALWILRDWRKASGAIRLYLMITCHINGTSYWSKEITRHFLTVQCLSLVTKWKKNRLLVNTLTLKTQIQYPKVSKSIQKMVLLRNTREKTHPTKIALQMTDQYHIIKLAIIETKKSKSL